MASSLTLRAQRLIMMGNEDALLPSHSGRTSGGAMQVAGPKAGAGRPRAGGRTEALGAIGAAARSGSMTAWEGRPKTSSSR